MKIVNRKAFLAMPPQTLFSKFQLCVFGELQIKGESLENDYFYQSIADAVNCDDSWEFSDILVDATEKGTSFSLDLDCQGRDGCFDEDQLFAVWEPADVAALVTRLQQCFPDKPAGTTS